MVLVVWIIDRHKKKFRLRSRQVVRIIQQNVLWTKSSKNKQHCDYCVGLCPKMMSPVQILGRGTTEDRGENARLNCFAGTHVITDLMKTTLGPKGTNCMLLFSDEGLSVEKRDRNGQDLDVNVQSRGGEGYQ